MSTTFRQKVTILAKAINKNKPFCLACGSSLILNIQDTMPHIALCCLERLRRTDDVTTILTGHDATHSALLPGGQCHE